MSVLNEFEKDLLQAFFALTSAKKFALTGGAALTEFYFQHRLSNDLDFFTHDEDSFVEIGSHLSELARVVDAEEKPIRSLQTLNQVMYRRGDQEIKIDIVRDSGPQFGLPQQFGVVRVDTLENIGANKIGALFGRAAFRDYVDLYFILHEGGLTFPHLLELAKQKDIGLQEFYLASWIKQQTPKLHTPPTMLKEVDFEEVKNYFLKLADDLMAGLNPDEKNFF